MPRNRPPVLLLICILFPLAAQAQVSCPDFERAAGNIESGCAKAASTTARKISLTSTYDEVVSGARRCTAQEKCVVAGGLRGCRCPVAVRENAKGAVDAAARVSSCEQVERLYCPPLTNAHCEKEYCVADPVPE
jgi:hypothetical protein